MTRVPRDFVGEALVRALRQFGYAVTRQTGSHLRLTHIGPPQRYPTIPAHQSLKIGTLAAMPKEAAAQQNISCDEWVQRLFG